MGQPNPFVHSSTAEGSVSQTKSYTFSSPSGSSGVFFVGGFYDFPAVDADLTQALPTVNFGTANNSSAAHAFVVMSGAGTATGGSGLVEVEISGTSISDNGVRTINDTEVIISDVTSTTTNQYLETVKKWLGTITYTVQAVGNHTTFASTFNYGFAKYDDFGNRDFTITNMECVGKANSNDGGFNIELLEHFGTGATGWSYSAAAFTAGNGNVADMNTDHGTEQNLVSGKPFAWKRANLSEFINGTAGAGFIVRITTGANNAVLFLDVHVAVEFS